MTDSNEFIENFLEHRSIYDPVKAREYYLRTRKLKGRIGVQKDAQAKAYETHVVGNAQKKLNSDLKGAKVKMNPARRIDAAEQKLIRAKSLAARVKDPVVKADMLAQISAMEKKLRGIKTRIHVHSSKKITHRSKPVLRRKNSVSNVKSVNPTQLDRRSHANRE